MSLTLDDLKFFLADQRGAITVDYVVLTAAATGVALASTDLVIDGLQSLADTVTEEMSGEAVNDPSEGLTYADGFDNGASGWIGAIASDIYGIGNVLGPIEGSGGVETVSKTFEMMAGLTHSTMTFDVLAMDSLDNESGIIYVGGQEVGRITKNGTSTVFTPTDVPGITISADIVDQGTQLGGNTGSQDWWTDSRTTISITVDEPDELLSIGFGSTADQGVNDEFFALDNFTVTGLNDPDAQTEAETGV